MYALSIHAATTEELLRITNALHSAGLADVSVKTTEAKTPKKSEPAPAAPAAEKPEVVPSFIKKTPVSGDLYEKVKDMTEALLGISRQTAVATLGEFGVISATKLKPAQYQAFIDRAEAVIAENSAALA